MRILSGNWRQGERGLSLMLVMAFMAVSFLLISGVLYSSSNAALQANRNRQYHEAQQAAIAAAERAVAGMVRDVQATGALGGGGFSNYEVLPSPAEYPVWGDYEFDIDVASLSQNTVSPMIWKYDGLTVTNDRVRVIAGARTLNLETPIASVVEQEIQVAEIPLFSYMLYSEFDMSFITPPGNDIQLGGRVHSNRDIYCFPSAQLNFTDHVTAAGEIYLETHPADPSPRAPGSVLYSQHGDSQANRLLIAPGAADPYVVLTRLANQADFRVRVFGTNDTNILAFDGSGTVSYPQVTNFVSTNVHEMYDARELRLARGRSLDVRELLGLHASVGFPRLICLQDETYYGPDVIASFWITNAHLLPPGGISIVSTNAVYLIGDYNTNRTPSMVAANAVTFLSNGWVPTVVPVPPATSTTYNLALLTGTVPSDADDGVFDGGVFNAVRLLEDWNGQTLTFNGAVATPFVSRHVVDPEPWRGAEPYFYFAPTTRIFNYDTAFLTTAGLPRGTPTLYALVRSEMVLLAPDTVF